MDHRDQTQPSCGPRAAAADLAAELGRLCPPVGIDLAGAVALPVELPHRAAWLAWLARGDHAGLAYLERDPQGRADPTRRDPELRSLLVFAQRYTDGWAPDDPAPREGLAARGRWLDGVARYARGRDYHDVFAGGAAAVVTGLRERWPALRAHVVVDTGPFLEREYALLAGLGFIGKNTCLIHESLGSGLFLALAATDLAIDGLPPAAEAAPLYALRPRRPLGVDPAVATRCGTCTRCLDACPTGALRAPFTLDARRCIATWTIEWRGRAPAGERHRQGGLVFGCDICQAVCPWNHRAATAAVPPPPLADYAPWPRHEEIGLDDLLRLDAAAFRANLRRSPLWRAHAEGLRRNALVAAAGARRRDLLPRIRELAAGDADPEVREVAAWAAAVLAEDA